MSVRHARLALLSEGPKYGLQLREEFVERSGEVRLDWVVRWLDAADGRIKRVGVAPEPQATPTQPKLRRRVEVRQ